MDQHVTAAISMLGNLLDAVGGLYLAYDLLGGEKGMLRILIRIVNYSMVIGLVFGLVFGIRFGAVAGIGMGTAIGIQMARASRGKPETIKFIATLATIRSLSIGLATWLIAPPIVAILMAAVIFATGFILPRIGLSPPRLFLADKKPSFSREKLMFSLALTGTIAGVVGLTAFVLGGEHLFLQLGFKVAGAVALMTTIIGLISPVVEWYADRLPLRTIGHVGAILFIIGFFLQAIPNLIVLLDWKPL
jgi:hypothetical protein